MLVPLDDTVAMSAKMNLCKTEEAANLSNSNLADIQRNAGIPELDWQERERRAILVN